MENDDSSWVFDSLVCFLNGPVWNAPLQSFIEEKSLIFEPNNEEHPECKVIYDEFKNLVDLMLGTYMDDIGITPEQFEIACSKQYTSDLPLQFHKNLFEQIWAANDYEIFKRMMCQKNIELQLQALELIETQYGITPKSFRVQTKSEENVPKATQVEMQDKIVMEEVKKEIIADPKPEPPVSDIKQITNEYQNHLEGELEIKKQELQTALQTAISAEATVAKEIQEITPEISPGTSNPAKHSSKIDEAELKKRHEYLKTQRDKLVALKKQVREKQLKTNIEIEAKNQRPKSARVAEAVMAGNAESEPRNLQIRRALAERLRNEVVSQKDD